MFRECGDCNLCCKGWLRGSAYGKEFYQGKPCFYLQEEKCSIYENRPEACKKYFCAWVQGLFSEELKPTISGVIVSVEVDNKKRQFLKVVETRLNINKDVYSKINNFCLQNDTYFVIVPYESEQP